MHALTRLRARAVHRGRAVLVPPAVLTALALVLGGCSSAGTATTGAPAQITPVDDTQAAVGSIDTVTWALPDGEPASLDPALTGDEQSNTVVTNLCESLLRLRSDFSTTPNLATRIVQQDAKTVVITLRPGVRFWDGAAMTAEDVAYSLRRHLDPAVGSYSAATFQAVSSITATGPLQVTVRFTRTDVQFIDSMAGVAGAISEKAYVTRIGEKAYGSSGTHLMCTGPFTLGAWTSGDGITMKRNDAYWDVARRARAATFRFVFLTDQSTLTSALRSGEVDGSYEVPTASVASLKASGVGSVYIGDSTVSYSVGPVAATGPAADPMVRRALDLAIDKTSLIASILKGYGRTLKTFTPPQVWAGSPARAVYDAGYAALPDTGTANIAEAKKVLAQTTLTRRDLVLAVPAGNVELLQTATIIQADARPIGLNVTIKQLQAGEYAGLFYEPDLRTGIDLVVAAGYVEVPGVLYYAPAFALQGGQFNWTGYHDAAVTREITAAVGATDPQTSARHFVAAQQVFAAAELQISLAQAYNLLFMNRRITGAPASFAFINGGWAAQVGASGA